MSSKLFSSLTSADRIEEQSRIVRSNRDKLDNFWIFGAGNNGRKIYELLGRNGKNVVGFVDETPEKIGQKIDRVEIFSFADFQKMAASNHNVVISIFSARHSFLDFYKKLNTIKVNKIVSSHEFFCMYDQEFYFIEKLGDVKENIRDYQRLFNLLPDNASREALINYLNLKVNFKFYTKKHNFFEPLKPALKNYENLTFIDAGAFDGDTVILFCNQFRNKVKKIIALEPDFANYNNLLKNLLGKKINSLCLNIAVSNETQVFRFNAVGNMGSALDTSGDTLVQTITVDELSLLVPGNSKLIIKMDIEGYEVDSISGMKNTIKELKPSLAISAYHKPKDLLEIVERVLKINSSYQVHLRFHGCDGADLIAYFI